MKLLALFFLIFTLNLFAKDYKIVTEHFPPYQIYENGKLTGISVEIINEIQRRAGTSYPTEVLIWDKAYSKALNNDNYIIFSMGRTLAREKNFHWVGPISTLKYVLFKSNLNTLSLRNLDDAKKAAGILVNKNDVTHQVLLRLNFRNLIIVNDASSDKNIRTLANLDKNVFWATDLKNGLYKIKDLGLEDKIKPTMINKPISSSTINIAFNKKADPKVVKEWNEILNEIKKDGTYQKILRKYL